MMFSITGLYHDTGRVSRNKLYIYVIVLVTFIYCCVLYIFHVSYILLGLEVLYISAIIVHIHFQRICVTDIIMLVLRCISQSINGSRANKVLKDHSSW